VGISDSQLLAKQTVHPILPGELFKSPRHLFPVRIFCLSLRICSFVYLALTILSSAFLLPVFAPLFNFIKNAATKIRIYKNSSFTRELGNEFSVPSRAEGHCIKTTVVMFREGIFCAVKWS
jgi:hypothetical protein